MACKTQVNFPANGTSAMRAILLGSYLGFRFLVTDSTDANTKYTKPKTIKWLFLNRIKDRFPRILK